jgi:hypothetical protein
MSISKAQKEKKAAKNRLKKSEKKAAKPAPAPPPKEVINEEEEDLDEDAQISLNPDFSFEVQGDALETRISTLSTWKFAKDACLKKRMGVLATTLDEKIERSRNEMVSKDDDNEEEEADEEMDEPVAEEEEEDEALEEDIELDEEQNDLFNAVTNLSDSEGEEEVEVQDTLRDKV